eukprot:TRINITY_DN14142_c0_g1_i2.p1 TRINITY_DN14142_c0_g1~~TRINITY_DN14142_c0_g1_i2.p1  ORF type:complete len:108 (-),score=25.78 TRINITY_DN14142_c0_g1_i2:228-551(-)
MCYTFHHEFVFFFFLRRRPPPRSPLSSSSAASDVYKRQGLLRRLDHDGFDTYIHRFKAKGKRAGTKPTGTAKRTALAMCLPDLRKEHDAGDDDEEEQEEEGEYYWSE